MKDKDEIIIINGEDRTDSVVSYRVSPGKCDIVFENSTQVYTYNSNKIKIRKLQQTIDPRSVLLRYKGVLVPDIREIRLYGQFVRVVHSNGKEESFLREDVTLAKNCLAEEKNKKLFDYFKETAAAISLKTEAGVNILSKQYDMIAGVDECTVLKNYLDSDQPIAQRVNKSPLIFPFGLNQSQKTAVENAFSSQVSIIQGPPGTGKTQTILNIIANAVMSGASVAVVSNNNSAIKNVSDKLDKYGLSFLSATLGSVENKTAFIDSQSGMYPHMDMWHMDKEEKAGLSEKIKALLNELNTMLESKNRIASINQELLYIRPELFYFESYYSNVPRPTAKNVWRIKKLSSDKLLRMWLQLEALASGQNAGALKKLGVFIRYGRGAAALFKESHECAIAFIQHMYYRAKISELCDEKDALERSLNNYNFEDKMIELSDKSMRLFKDALAHRFDGKTARPIYEMGAFRRCSEEFNREYPVILSTTYSIKGTLSTHHVYDYLIVDEASQVDLATGVLAFSCAKNIVIVGDQKQLPNVLTPEDIRKADIIWDKYHFDLRYQFSKHSMLSSAALIWKDVPSVLLREHYRCHPKIANFFNQKFYDGQLLIMSRDHGEKNVLTMYRTAPGNHARGHLNQRQIDVIRNEVLPMFINAGYTDIGIITPYREQVAALQKQMGNKYETATVHKFQGREKDAIILAAVDNEIGQFVNDPNLLNVAVSRAIRALAVVVSDNTTNEKTNYGDLARYIEYNNLHIVDSGIHSIFDLLYKDYNEQRKEYLKKHKRISEYDSENLAYSVIERVLECNEFSSFSCATHVSMSTLFQDKSQLTPEEAQYASNPFTHIDFLIINKMDKHPLMAIEVDGTRYHAEGTRQAERDKLKNSVLYKYGLPLLRIRTDESGIEAKISTMLKQIVAK